MAYEDVVYLLPGFFGFDRFAGMSQDEIDDDRLILADPAAARAKLDQE